MDNVTRIHVIYKDELLFCKNIFLERKEQHGRDHRDKRYLGIPSYTCV
nr:MAG TPA: hypothetical protein [Caudoviricetes sp.]